MNFLEWKNFHRQNKPQGNAVSGGLFFMLASGFQVGWIFSKDLMSFPWTEERSNSLIIVTYVVFYITAVLGLFAACFTIDRLSKKIIYLTSLLLASLGSFILILMPNNLYLIMLARSLIGFGHGCVYLTAMIHASEIMTQKLRGMIVSSIHFMTVSSILISGALTMFEDQKSNALGSFQWIGVTSLVFCIIGFVSVPILTRESPLTLMKERKFNEALFVMVELRSKTRETPGITSEFNDLKTMLEEDELSSKNILKEGNLHTLQLIVLLKIGSVLAFNFCVNVIRLKYTTMFAEGDDINVAAVIFMTLRLVGCVISIFTIDSIGRRPHLAVSFGGSSIFLIAMAVVIMFDSSLDHWVIGSLQLCFEFIGGLGIGMISDVYTSEAFNTMKKPLSIAVTTGIEFCLQAVIISATFRFVPSENFDWIYLLIAGGLMLPITVYLFMKLPETAGASIRQTRREFEKIAENNFQITPS